MARKSPTRRHSSRRLGSPERDYGSSSRSRSPSRRESSPARRNSHRERGSSPVRERHASRTKSPKREKSSSPVSRSPSPRTKRLRRAHVEREAEKVSERELTSHEKGCVKSKHERNHRDKGVENEVVKDRRERRSERERERERDVADTGSFRSRQRRSMSPSDRHRHRTRHHSRSPPPASNSRVRVEDANLREADHRDVANDSLSKMKATEEELATKQKQQPSFELSGKLAAETNRVRGITLLFHEPPDARKPDVRWRLYVFKNGEVLNEPLYVHRQSCYLFGRERRVADIPTDHPSCSKQHAVLQFRQVEKEKPDGMMSKQTRPYLMDLGSTNKTFINENPIEPQRYYELFEKDTIKFGNSSREYVLLHENSA